ncbi:MAG: hypothetical protein JXA10_05420 [Anaerolineae bacterium]|nr:hypothetical protein [Anaerolineae bacterium]
MKSGYPKASPMPTNNSIPRKWKLTARDQHNVQHNVFAWGMNERAVHVVMKALIWALYLPQYPASRVEVRIGDKYKPDVVQLNAQGEPEFWGEAGMVGKRKIESLVRRYKNTHFVIGKWDARLDPFEKIVSGALEGVDRSAPFDLIRFPDDSIARFIDDEGVITIAPDDLEWLRLE